MSERVIFKQLFQSTVLLYGQKCHFAIVISLRSYMYSIQYYCIEKKFQILKPNFSCYARFDHPHKHAGAGCDVSF